MSAEHGLNADRSGSKMLALAESPTDSRDLVTSIAVRRPFGSSKGVATMPVSVISSL
jgi:hypothetical protein